jgi:hypothetical protein
MPTPDRDYDFDEVMETYRKDGSLLRAKSRIILEERFLPEAYRRLGDEAAPTSAVVEIAKVLVDIGDVKPKQNTPPTQGPGFSITINLPGSDNPPITISSPAHHVIEGEATPVEDEIPGENPAQLLPPEPVNFNTPAMDFMFDAPEGLARGADDGGES